MRGYGRRAPRNTACSGLDCARPEKDHMSNVKTITLPGDQDLHIREDAPTDWFESLYKAANIEGEGVPWANMDAHAALKAWLAAHPQDGTGKTALVIGCGMGDDAVHLQALGFDVTAFDVSEAAIGYCNARFADSPVRFQAADLFDPPAAWNGAFDFVLEIYTVQALPPRLEDAAIDAVTRLVAPGGTLLVVAETAEGPRTFEKGPPWLLTPAHPDAFVARGLTVRTQESAPGELGTEMVTAFERPK